MDQNQANANAGAGPAAPKEDYVDKGLDAAEKKLGYKQDRNVNEKITDGARGLFEKATGKKVSDKVSN